MEKKKQRLEAPSSRHSFESTYPNMARWVMDGWIEIGHGSYGDSFVKAYDEGGAVWEGQRKYPMLEDVLQDLERGVAKWFEENE